VFIGLQQGQYGRFQILNDREGRMDWYKLAQEDYGKFTNSTSPYHLWEVGVQKSNRSSFTISILLSLGVCIRFVIIIITLNFVVNTFH
jgi:hypothetical protein